jgi:signal transduction histidine kinase
VGVLSLLGAALISSLVNLPLARLTAAARAIAQGKRPAPLPEKGSQEIIEANRSFNQMVDDLQQLEKDRAMILAGISHDLRTPLARMQLEVEMANLSQEAREGMQSDIGRWTPSSASSSTSPADRGRHLRAGRPVRAAGRLRARMPTRLPDVRHHRHRAGHARAGQRHRPAPRDQQRDRERAPLRQDPGRRRSPRSTSPATSR